MASILKVDKIRVTGLDSDSISFDNSGNITFNKTVTGDNNTMVLLNTTVVSSGVSEIDFNGLFSSTYQNYELHGTNVHVSGDGAHIGARILIGGAVKSDSHYRYTRMRIYSGTASHVDNMVVGAAEQTDTDFAMFGGESNGNAAGEQSNFKITIFDPLGTDNYKTIKTECSYIDLSPDAGQIHGSGHYKNGTAALSGIRLFPNSGNIDSGTFRLYGVK